jgi:hypothetical protein
VLQVTQQEDLAMVGRQFLDGTDESVRAGRVAFDHVRTTPDLVG